MTAHAPAVWSNRFAFLMASVGFAVGLGNIWRFPYVTGENGGSAFILIYLLCVIAIGVPCLMAELLIGRRGQKSPTRSMINVAIESNESRNWAGVGGLGVATAYLISITYAVVVGWVLWYLFLALTVGFIGFDAGIASREFDDLLADGSTMLTWTVIGNLIVGSIIFAGLQGGIERAVTVMMPLLFILMVGLGLYNTVAGGMADTVTWLFTPDFSKVNSSTLLAAVGQAFFSIGVGMGGMMTYGSYLPSDFSIARGAITIVLADTLIAMLAGFVVFPAVFKYDLDMASGPGLIFQTLPVAFSQMPGGQLFAVLFFLMLAVAGVTSMVGLLESVTGWTEQRFQVSRRVSTLLVVGSCTVCSIASVLSYNIWSDFRIFGLNFNEFADGLPTKVMLPLSGLLIALFVGWFMQREFSSSELRTHQRVFMAFIFLLRFVVVPALAMILISGLIR